MIARGLEVNGIATTLTTWNPGLARIVAPPRYTYSKLLRGSTVGAPNDSAQQRRVLLETLNLLEQSAPLIPVKLNESQEK